MGRRRREGRPKKTPPWRTGERGMEGDPHRDNEQRPERENEKQRERNREKSLASCVDVVVVVVVHGETQENRCTRCWTLTSRTNQAVWGDRISFHHADLVEEGEEVNPVSKKRRA